MNLKIDALIPYDNHKKDFKILKNKSNSISLMKTIVIDKDTQKNYVIYVTLEIKDDKIYIEGFYDLENINDKDLMEQISQWTLNTIKIFIKNWIKNEEEKIKEEKNESKSV